MIWVVVPSEALVEPDQIVVGIPARPIARERYPKGMFKIDGPGQE